jgi:hypothetical protein
MGPLVRVSDFAPSVGGGFPVVENRVGRDQNSSTGAMNAPTQIEIVAVERQVRIEPSEVLPHILADQHSGGTHRHDIAHPVVLTLVVLAPLETGNATTVGVDRHARF